MEFLILTGMDIALGNLNVGSTVLFWVKGIVNAATLPGTITNTVNALLNGTIKNSTTATTAVVNEALLSITKSADKSPAEYNVGDTITYTITVSNAGPSNAHNVDVTDTIPTGLQYVTSSDGGVFNAGVVTWAPFELANGKQITRTVTVKVLPEAAAIKNITNTATAKHDFIKDPVSTNATVRVLSASLVISKTANPPILTVGKPVTFTIKVTNNGPDTATGVFVNDKLPSGLTYQSSTATVGSYNNGVWIIGNMTVGTSETLNLIALVEQQGSYANTATVG